ncbi:MAG TPA: nucleoside triphosphate pyrophosphatase [Myxococcaceae bacterium]|nr:nucleoside triphosphate pyrophosphatase [Myxococcaceae bacterium]
MSSTPSPQLVLASGSPRRRELLGQLGLKFEVHPADIDESVRPGERPEDYVLRVAEEKAAKVASEFTGALVVAADTSVVLRGEVLGKPEGEAGARAMLSRLSGTHHRVITAVAAAGTFRKSFRVETEVRFRALSAEEIGWYAASGEPEGKSGSYALQGVGAFMVQSVTGSVSNVVGLPLGETVALLREAGFPLPWDRA